MTTLISYTRIDDTTFSFDVGTANNVIRSGNDVVEGVGANAAEQLFLCNQDAMKEMEGKSVFYIDKVYLTALIFMYGGWLIRVRTGLKSLVPTTSSKVVSIDTHRDVLHLKFTSESIVSYKLIGPATKSRDEIVKDLIGNTFPIQMTVDVNIEEGTIFLAGRSLSEQPESDKIPRLVAVEIHAMITEAAEKLRKKCLGDHKFENKPSDEIEWTAPGVKVLVEIPAPTQTDDLLQATYLLTVTSPKTNEPAIVSEEYAKKIVEDFNKLGFRATIKKTN